MTFQIQDAALEARIQKQIENIGASNVEEVLMHLLETQEGQDEWLLLMKDSIQEQIQTGIDEADRGELIYEDELLDHLSKLKSELK